MRKISVILVAMACVLFAGNSARADLRDPGVPDTGSKVIKICVEERDWYPFLYAEGRQARGILVDMAKEAVARAGFSMEVEPFPLKRCIKLAEHGRVDGVAAIPYSKQFARFLEYPAGAAVDKESPWRIMQIDQVVVTFSGNDFEFDGDLRTLPQPVRVPFNDPIGVTLKQAGLETEEAKTDRQNVAKLIRDRKGSVITTTVTAETLAQDESFRGMIEIQAVPLRSRSYFLSFSWKSSLSEFERRKIWEELERLRSDYVFMLQLLAQY